MKPKVSVVVPVYNVERYLARCMDSLLNQTLKEIQIVLVNDGSTDGSGTLCDRYAALDERVKVIHKQNQGLGMARNSGIEAADGEYVGFVDSDDYVESDMFYELYASAVKCSADMAFSGMKQIGGSVFSTDQEVIVREFVTDKEVFSGKTGRKKLLLGTAGALPREDQDSRYNFSVCKGIYRNSVLQEKKLRFLSERKLISEDVFFLLDFIGAAENAVGIPGAFYCYCRNDVSISKQYREDRFPQSKRMIQELCRRLEQYMSEQEHQLYTDRQFQAYARICVIWEIQHAREIHSIWQVRKKRVLEICSDEDLQKSLKRYPYHQLPRMQAIFAFAMRYRMVGFLSLLVYLREKR